MAAIDKIYVDSFEKYNIFKEWCRYQPTIKDKSGIRYIYRVKILN